MKKSNFVYEYEFYAYLLRKSNYLNFPKFSEKVRTRRNGVNHMDSNLFTKEIVVESDARETGSPEEATLSTSQDISSINTERRAGSRKPRSASADRILETSDTRGDGGAVSALSGEDRGQSGPWTSWGHQRRRLWRRSLSGSQSLSQVGNTSLSVHR